MGQAEQMLNAAFPMGMHSFCGENAPAADQGHPSIITVAAGQLAVDGIWGAGSPGL